MVDGHWKTFCIYIIFYKTIQQWKLSKFEDIKWVMKCKSKKDRQYNGKKKRVKGRNIVYKAPTENLRLRKMNPTENRGWTQMLQKDVPAPLVTPVCYYLTTQASFDMEIMYDCCIE